MNVDVHFSKIFGLDAQLAVAAAKETERGLNRFLHYFTDVSGERDAALPRIPGCFDVQYFAAGWRICQAGSDAWLTRFEFGFANVFGWSQ